ncbi:MAG: hypothetical protein OHK0056_30810 [Bacteriovoracaceae bacterium]
MHFGRMAKNMKGYLIIILILASLVSFQTMANNPFFPLKMFDRCYKIFTNSFPDQKNVLRIKVSQGLISYEQGCMDLLNQTNLTSNKTVQGDLSISILRTFQAFHSSWFPSFLTFMTDDVPQTFDIVELESPALFVTKSLFDDEFNFSQIVVGDNDFEGIRSNSNKPDYYIGSRISPKISISENPPLHGKGNYSPWNPHFNDRGPLIGIRKIEKGRDILPSHVNNLFYPQLFEEPIDIHQSAGGGLMGTNPYLIFNLGRSLGDRANGGSSIPRKFVQQIFSDVLCRDLPVLNVEDTEPFLEEDKVVSWSNNHSCMSCHVTMDHFAGLVRNAELVFSNEDGKASAHIKFHPTKYIIEDQKPFYRNDKDYFQSKPDGRLIFRDFDNNLVNIYVKNLNEVGVEFSKRRDMYVCATIRYLEFLTGTKVSMAQLRNNYLEKKLSPEESEIIKIADKFKRADNLKSLISDILKSSFFTQN